MTDARRSATLTTMWRRLLIVAFVAFAVLGLWSPGYERALVGESHAEQGHAEQGALCCPCEDDGEGCCDSAVCACGHATFVAPERAGEPEPRTVASSIVPWTVASEQRARDRSSAPPTPPPIG